MENQLILSRGFTLLEITISMTVFFIGILGISSFIPGTFNINEKNQIALAHKIYQLSLYDELCLFKNKYQINDHKMINLKKKNSLIHQGIFFLNSFSKSSGAKIPFSYDIKEVKANKNSFLEMKIFSSHTDKESFFSKFYS